MSSTLRFKCRIFLEKQHQFRVKSLETAKMNKTFKTHLERFSKKVPLSYFNKKGLNEFIDYLRFTAELEEIEISALQGPVGHIEVSWDKLKFPEKWDQKWDQS